MATCSFYMKEGEGFNDAEYKVLSHVKLNGRGCKTSKVEESKDYTSLEVTGVI